MSILSQAAKPKNRPVILTITGDSGIGKTSTACTFQDPIVIRAEDGLMSVPESHRPDAFPVLETVDQLWEQIGALINEDHKYKTLVVDSVTALERLFTDHIIASDPKKPKSINQAMGGYGAGTAAVGGLHQQLRRAAGILNQKKGMHVVFIAHADTETIELPDQDPYTRYSLRLGKKSMAPYIDDVDLVGFIKLKVFTKDKKAISDGSRVMTCSTTASHVSKNRYGITDDLPVVFGKNPLEGVI